MSSNVRAARNRPGRTDPQPPTGAPLFVGVLGLLLATGWVANHFVGLMPAISDRDHLAT